MKISRKKINSLIDANSIPTLTLDKEFFRARIVDQLEGILVAHQVVEWHFDGLVIIDTGYLSGIRYGEVELVQEKILKRRRNSNIAVVPKWLHLKSWVTVLQSLRAKKKLCCLQSRKDIADFQLGFVTEVGDKHFYFHRLDLMYRLVGSTPSKFPIKNIGYISFNNEYCRVVQDYLASYSRVLRLGRV